MRNKRTVLMLGLILIGALAFSMRLWFHSAKVSPPSNKPFIAAPIHEANEAIRLTGWSVPDVSKMELFSIRVPYNVTNECPKCNETIYKPPKQPDITLQEFTPEERQRLIGNLPVCDVAWVIVYDFDGRIFCYHVTMSPRRINLLITVDYYDDDNDGIFETAVGRSKLRLPRWLKSSQ